jgi:hypothetical protein
MVASAIHTQLKPGLFDLSAQPGARLQVRRTKRWAVHAAGGRSADTAEMLEILP